MCPSFEIIEEGSIQYCNYHRLLGYYTLNRIQNSLLDKYTPKKGKCGVGSSLDDLNHFPRHTTALVLHTASIRQAESYDLLYSKG